MMMVNNVPKPSGSKWTDEQWNAITARGKNVLVAAAAGSGKTAVLVERIIRMISDSSDPIDVDRLLVATFTKAAADEMRQRIREALENRLDEEPDNEHLRRQLAYIHRASITTLHAFCLEVIQQDPNAAGLPPSFRIGNETETALIRREVMEEMFETMYTVCEPEHPFWQLVDCYSGERSDDPLFGLVERLYEYARSHPWPETWLESMAADFNGDGQQWLSSLQRDLALELAEIHRLLQTALKLAEKPGGPATYVDMLQEELAAVDACCKAATELGWAELHERVHRVKFGRLKSARSEDIDKSIQEQAKSLRDQAKKKLAELTEECFGRTLEQHLEDCHKTAPLMRELVRLVREFSLRYEKAKLEKGIVDFSDLEHYCLKVLLKENANAQHMEPSETAEQYRQQFEEVLLDEYQDTNLVQETIVALISRPSKCGNRFMVGDVKQSIYRFRLAEPELFMQKYDTYVNMNTAVEMQLQEGDNTETGIRIDLARNFRSRDTILHGVNFIFKQMMSKSVAELAYDDRAKLIPGATFPTLSGEGNKNTAIDVLLLTKKENKEVASTDETNSDRQEEELLNNAQLEARAIATQIKRILGKNASSPMYITDKQTGQLRPPTYRDIVILLRATRDWSPILMEELRLSGIPAYAEMSTGYFAAGEVEVMMALLKIIDNPYQDIPLAAVLRSPIVRVREEELALIRIVDKKCPFYDAIRKYVTWKEANLQLKQKLERFLHMLALWRREARQSLVSDLLWRIYRLTGYYDTVGAMDGGTQRQANLRALYERARQYERTSFRGLFRFLQFIERMQEQGGDLGAPADLGEQEDVVRIMSIHKSKGLEFPIVIVAGLGKKFNMMDMNSPFLLHKELGFGPRYVDSAQRTSYPTLAHLAIRRRLRLQMLAEEMRVLYVAMTRAKEKLILIGTVGEIEKTVEEWGRMTDYSSWTLPEGLLAKARSYLDLIGPALIRHPDAAMFRERGGINGYRPPETFQGDPSRWCCEMLGMESFEMAAPTREARDETVMQAIYKGEPVYHLYSTYTDQIESRLSWSYPYATAAGYFSKTSVSEMKRRLISEERTAIPEDAAILGEEVRPQLMWRKTLLHRPRFMEDHGLTAAERGTLYHTVMQHLPLDLAADKAVVSDWLDDMIVQQRLPAIASKEIEPGRIADFLASPLASRMRSSSDLRRELPFSFGIPAGDVYAEQDEMIAKETILMQGVIDCIFYEENGWVLIDYKTDHLSSSRGVEQIKARYSLQIKLYTKAVEHILHQKVKQACLYLFDGDLVVEMHTE